MFSIEVVWCGGKSPHLRGKKQCKLHELPHTSSVIFKKSPDFIEQQIFIL